MTETRKAIRFTYTNHNGETATRTVRPLRVWFGETPWHDGMSWHLDAHDVERNATRSFVMAKIRDIQEVEL